jgi:hypothetical protein
MALAVLGAALAAGRADAQTEAVQAAVSARRQPVVPVVRRANDVHIDRAALDEARRISVRIDELIAAGYEKNRIKPSPVVDDAAFLRRASIDVTGKIPVVNNARKFLADSSPEKRAEAIERMLSTPAYVNHFTNMWRDLLIPEANADFQRRYLMPSLDRWLRKQLANNVSYDKMVRELVAMPIGNRGNEMMYYRSYDGSNYGSPMAFYFAKQGKPEDIAASIVRLFLGIRLECAQCHDHPFGKWKREEFWSQAAFFAGLKGNRNGDFFFGPLNEVQDRRELNIPNTERVAQARFLDGKQPKWKFKIGARTTLADWMTAKDNPFFARALVNRMWAHFFGIGLVEPVDDLVDDNKASHPELLDMLAREFAQHDFDLKFLIRAITLSRTYQLSSITDPAAPTELRLFARMPVKGLTSEQLYDSLCEATGVRDYIPLQNRIYQFRGTRQLFADKFGDQEKKTEYHSSIPQALTMMNNDMIINATHPDRSQVLGAIVAAPFMTNAGRIEALFLAALSRKPRPEEAEKFLRYVERESTTVRQKKALSDVFWALLNSTEFKFNH